VYPSVFTELSAQGGPALQRARARGCSAPAADRRRVGTVGRAGRIGGDYDHAAKRGLPVAARTAGREDQTARVISE